MPSLHSFRDWFLSRLPGRRDASLVFGVVLFAVFGWSIRGFLFKLPALALYFGLGANLAVLSYMLSFALLESLLVMLVLLAVCALLPPRVLRDGFAYKAFLILAVTIIGLIRFEDYYKVEFFKDIMAHNYESIYPLVRGTVISIVSFTGLAWVLHRWPALRKYPLYIMEQVSLFTYVYVPLGILGLLVVLFRNIP